MVNISLFLDLYDLELPVEKAIGFILKAFLWRQASCENVLVYQNSLEIFIYTHFIDYQYFDEACQSLECPLEKRF